MSIFRRKVKPKAQPQFLILHLTARIQPMHRGALEDALDQQFERVGLSSRVGGGGTLTTAEGRLVSCDIEVFLEDPLDDVTRVASALLTELGAPVGSWAGLSPEESTPFGDLEALSVRLTPAMTPEFLDDNVPVSTELNDILHRLNWLLGAHGFVASWHMHELATEIFVHGPSAELIEQTIRSSGAVVARTLEFERYATRV